MMALLQKMIEATPFGWLCHTQKQEMSLKRKSPDQK